MSGPTLWQKNPVLLRWRALEAQQNAIALLHTISSKHTEESSVSVILPMHSEKGYEERQLQKPLERGKKELQLFQEITSYDIEMPWNKCSFPLHPRTQGLHESSALTCMADKGFHP